MVSFWRPKLLCSPAASTAPFSTKRRWPNSSERQIQAPVGCIPTSQPSRKHWCLHWARQGTKDPGGHFKAHQGSLGKKKKKKRHHSGWSTVRGLTGITKLNWGSQETWESALVMLPTTFSALFKATQHLNLSQVSKPRTGKSSRNVPATFSSWYWINGAPDARSAVLRIGSHLWSWTIHLIVVSKCLYVRNTFSSCSYMIQAYVHRSPGFKSQVSSSLSKNFSSSYPVPSTVLALGFPGWRGFLETASHCPSRS